MVLFDWLSSCRGEDFLKFHPPFFLFLASWPSWLEVGISGHIFGRGPSKDHSTKVLLQLAKWFLRRRFLCEFPIGIEKMGDEILKNLLLCNY
jgi:hypothetical protein